MHQSGVPILSIDLYHCFGSYPGRVIRHERLSVLSHTLAHPARTKDDNTGDLTQTSSIHCYHNHFSHFLDANISREMYTTSVFHSRSLTVWRSGEVALSGIRRFQHQRSERYINPQHSFHVFEICALSSIIDQNYGRNSQKAGKGEKIWGRTPFSFVIFVEISGLFTDPLEEYKA